MEIDNVEVDKVEENKVETKPRYFIDLNRYEGSGRSFSALVQSRLCPSCQKKLGKKGFDPFATTKKCCSKKEDFITVNLPLKESLFRLFLSHGNKPLELEEIYNTLEERLAGVGDLRSFSQKTVQRLLEYDAFYGFSRVPEEETP